MSKCVNNSNAIMKCV